MAKSRRKSANLASKQEREMTRVFAYLRVSTEMQAKSGLGLGDQEAKVKAMATVKGWPEPTLFVDAGVSGTKESADRPQLKKLMALVEAGQVDAIIINSIDRLARKTRLTLELLDEFRRHGVVLVSCKEQIDTTTSAGQLLITVLAAMAQLERDLIGERTAAALAEHSRRDGESGGRLPYAYERWHGGVRVNSEAARHARRIFAMREKGAKLVAIADYLNKRQIISPQGKRWYASSVAAVLENEAYYRGGLRGDSQLRWPSIL